MTRKLLAAAIAGIAWGTARADAAPATRGTGSNAQIEEVVVTAQRTPARESRTPVAMSVLSDEQLKQAGIDRPSGLAARLPNVHLDGAADGLKITIRTPAWYEAGTRQRLTDAFVPPNRPPEQGFSHKATRGTSAELNWDPWPASLHMTTASCSCPAWPWSKARRTRLAACIPGPATSSTASRIPPLNDALM